MNMTATTKKYEIGLADMALCDVDEALFIAILELSVFKVMSNHPEKSSAFLMTIRELLQHQSAPIIIGKFKFKINNYELSKNKI